MSKVGFNELIVQFCCHYIVKEFDLHLCFFPNEFIKSYLLSFIYIYNFMW